MSKEQEIIVRVVAAPDYIGGGIQFVLVDVDDTLENLRYKSRHLNDSGYDPTEDDGARWRYVTAQDELVCNICRPLHGTMYRSTDIPTKFPYAIDIEAGFIKTNTHAPRDINCRCELQLINADERMEDMFDKEITV